MYIKEKTLFFYEETEALYHSYFYLSLGIGTSRTDTIFLTMPTGLSDGLIKLAILILICEL